MLTFTIDPAATHPDYGPCDGFGPLWTCSQCTGLFQSNDGAFFDLEGKNLTATEAANLMGDYLLERAEMAAAAAYGCSDSPAAVADFVREALLIAFPGEPWREAELFERIIAGERQPTK